MQGPIAQAFALAVFGNDIVRGGAPKNFWPQNSTFQFCKSVKFGTMSGSQNKPTLMPYADNPGQWYSLLAGAGIIGFRLLHVPSGNPLISDRESVGFAGGGGRWFVESIEEGAASLWEAAWEVGGRKDPDRKIWNVTYWRVHEANTKFEWQTRGLVRVRAELSDGLTAIAHFAETQKLDGFATCFRKGLAALESESPLAHVYHADLDHCSLLSREAKQLLASIQEAWVFGGMGSWNDQSFDGEVQKTYEQLSDRLFSTLIDTIVECANSTFAISR